MRCIVGCFLDLLRGFYSRAGEREELWLSSADWMNRNMLRRVETAWPVTDPGLRQRIIDECLVAYLYDEADAWVQGAGGAYSRVAEDGADSALSAQQALMARYGSNSEEGLEWT